jgi:hypothetical protein
MCESERYRQRAESVLLGVARKMNARFFLHYDEPEQACQTYWLTELENATNFYNSVLSHGVYEVSIPDRTVRYKNELYRWKPVFYDIDPELDDYVGLSEGSPFIIYEFLGFVDYK